ncbi:MAG: DUF2779 domain-containing protein [Yoonia sp.]
MQISKSDFVRYLSCPESFWLLKHKPDAYPHGELSDYATKTIAEAQKVKEYVEALLSNRPDAKAYSFAVKFNAEGGLSAGADVVRDNGDGTINLLTVKSSNSVKRDRKHNHIKEAAFLRVVAEASGQQISRQFVVHLNGDYVRQGDVDPSELLRFVDVTDEIATVEKEAREEIDAALSLLLVTEINENQCGCLRLTKSNHCDAFEYFNRHVPTPSIYDLPRLSQRKLEKLIAAGHIGLDDIPVEDVTGNQALVLQSAQSREPVINQEAIACFLEEAVYPLYFLDYETYSSAIPIADGARPQAPIPFQYSLHVKHSEGDGELEHFEYLAEEAALPIALIDHMQRNIGQVGSIVSWHSAFENTQNANMAQQYPDKAEFLNGLIERTLDLELVFKEGYLDIAFGGSTSIKKVLPRLVPELTYDQLAVASGTDAMEAWGRLISLSDENEKGELKKELFAYCKLDTLAMVRILEVIEGL